MLKLLYYFGKWTESRRETMLLVNILVSSNTPHAIAVLEEATWNLVIKQPQFLLVCLCNAINYKIFVKNIKSISLLLDQIDNLNFKLIDTVKEKDILNSERKVIRILMKVHLSSIKFNVWSVIIGVYSIC